MKSMVGWRRRFVVIGLLVSVLLFLAFGAASTEAATAALNITPSPNVKPGEVLKFSATVTSMATPTPSIMVILGGSMWTTEVQTVKFPTRGVPKAVVNFTKTYTVPADAKTGTSLCFSVVTGVDKDVKQPISDLTCVTVKVEAKAAAKGGLKQPVEARTDLLLSDLVIKKAEANSYANDVIIKALVANQGQSVAGASTLCIQVVNLSGKGSPIISSLEAPVKQLKAGEETWVEVDTKTCCYYRYDLTIDCKNVVKEGNENNNKASVTFK